MSSVSAYIAKAAWYQLRYWLSCPRRMRVKVLDSDATVAFIDRSHCSLGRYGDGELNMVFNYLDRRASRLSGFQKYDESMAGRLYDILREGGNDEYNFKVGLPGCMLSVGTGHLLRYSAVFWHEYSAKYLSRLLKILPKGRHTYLDSSFSRFYLSHKDKSGCRAYLDRVMSLWQGRRLIIVEGKFTCLGVGNDLFDGALSVSRIICPPTDAWDRYDDILSATLSEASGSDKPLILCALGMTATILTYDLARAGQQAIDIGHIDIEYEWMRMGAKRKVAVPGKFTNESRSGHDVKPSTDEKYLSQIVCRI